VAPKDRIHPEQGQVDQFRSQDVRILHLPTFTLPAHPGREWLATRRADRVSRLLESASFKRPEQLDRSMAGQLRLVEKSFEGLKPSDIHTLVHPEKPTLKAVEVR
jgi:hypothetical protein